MCWKLNFVTHFIFSMALGLVWCFTPQTETAYTTMCCKYYNLVAENTVPTEYVNSCTGKIENSLLFYLSDRKIVFKNTLLHLGVCNKVEFICTIRQYFYLHPAMIIF